MVIGQVTDLLGNGIGGAVITVAGVSGAAISLSKGYYIMFLPTGTFDITADIPGSAPLTHENVVITTENHTTLNFTIDIVKKGDINGDGSVNLADAIIALKVLAGLDVTGEIRLDYVSSGIDVNGDGKIGIAEVIYILQKISGLR